MAKYNLKQKNPSKAGEPVGVVGFVSEIELLGKSKRKAGKGETLHHFFKLALLYQPSIFSFKSFCKIFDNMKIKKNPVQKQKHLLPICFVVVALFLSININKNP